MEQPGNGTYERDEVVSALQKAIRRGDEVAAVWWATELLKAGEAKRLWARLGVICAEDVGLADPAATLLFQATATCWKLAKANHGSEAIATAAVVILARAKKNRELSMLASLTGDRRERGERLNVPDYAVDGHTAAGRRKWGSRDAERFVEWVEEGQLCHNVAGPNPYAEAWVLMKAKAKGCTEEQTKRVLEAIRQQYPSQ